jgi:hypothetical protein
MQASLRNLRESVRRALIEARSETVVLSDGSEVPYGSEEHIRDMQAILSGLQSLKSQQKYSTAARARFADAATQLKRMLSRATAEATPIEMEPSDVPTNRKGFDQAEPGQGRFEPGRSDP